MNNEFMSQFNDSSKASIETFQRFHGINVEALEKLARLQFNLTTLNVESTVEQARLLTSGSTPDVILEAESALARNYGERLMQITNETTAVLSESRDQLVAFAENTFKHAQPANDIASPKAKTAKKKTSKKTAKKAA